MRHLEYLITYKDGKGRTMSTRVSVYARNVGSGFRKVARTADKNIPASWGQVDGITFWKALS